MAKHAFVYDNGAPTAGTNGNHVTNGMAVFWEEDGESLTYTSDPTPINVEVTSLMLTGALIEAAVIAKTKAVASSLLGWSLGSDSVLLTCSFARG